jgi:capsular exopolysaccharide synthesis family protein
MKNEPNVPGAKIDPSAPRGYSKLNVDAMRSAGVGESAIQRSFRDYLLILRERILYVVIVFLAIFLASLVYTLTSTKQYTAMATIEILAKDPIVMKVTEVRDSDLRGPEDLNTQVKLLESGAIVQRVAGRLSADETKALVAPYDKGTAGDPVLPEDLLSKNRTVLPERMTRMLHVTYTHPDPDVAAKIANLFVEEYMNYNIRWRVDESMKAVEDLKVRAEEQSKKVEELGNNLQAYRERQNMVSLDQRKDIVTDKLKAVNNRLTEANAHVMEVGVRWNQVQECRKTGGDLTNLSFIAVLPTVQSLVQEVSSEKVKLADLKQRYRAKWPKMLETTQTLAQTQAELARALNNAAESIRNEYETAQRDAAQAKIDLAAQETEALKLDRFSVEYGTLQNEYNVNQELLANIVSRMRETTMSASIESQNARIVDSAGRPRKPSSPNIALNLSMGGVGGLGLGLSLAFLVAFIDDRVKSAYQVESVVGIPLVGIVPRIRKMDPMRRAQVVVNRADPLATEAFLSIHSSLRLKAEAKNAKVIVVTSTRPGEGKSFVASNLALAFAKHGERVIVVDCDLRKPNLHNGFGIPNAKGLIDCCALGGSLDAVIVKNHAPNLDILPTGGRANDPTNILNHEFFGLLIEELRKRYDRVFIDTPPLSPVSDAMIILPHADGVIFTLRFNFVRTKGAQYCVRRLREAGIPCFGAVLNGLDLALSDYYYAEYYDKSYKSYVEETGAAH